LFGILPRFTLDGILVRALPGPMHLGLRTGIFCAHHQEFSTVHSALVIFMQVYNVCLEAVIINRHGTYQCRMYSRKLLMMGRKDARNM